MSFEYAENRCAENGKEQCTPRRLHGGICTTDINWKKWYSWTTLGCMTQAKISYKTGSIGRVDYPDPDFAGYRDVSKVVDENTRNYFKVYWDINPSLPENAADCNSISCRSVEDGCICNTSVTETAAFNRSSDILSKESLFSSLHFGTFDPDMFDDRDIFTLGNCNVDNIEIYSYSSDDSCASLGTSVFFGVTDTIGVKHYLKNIKSTVEVLGVNASFRNVPHFISFVDQDLRDMYYETDAGKEFLNVILIKFLYLIVSLVLAHTPSIFPHCSYRAFISSSKSSPLSCLTNVTTIRYF